MAFTLQVQSGRLLGQVWAKPGIRSLDCARRLFVYLGDFSQIQIRVFAKLCDSYCHCNIQITGGINRCFITWVFLSSPSPPRAVLWWNLLAHAAALLAPSSFSCKFPLWEQQQRTDSDCWLAPVQCSRQLTCMNAQWYQSRLLSHSEMTFCALAEMFAVKQICSLYVIFKGWKWTSYMHLLNEINTQPNIITHVNW